MNRVFVSIILCFAAAVPPALGLSGGPFGNDSSLSTGGSGTYQGVMSGKNLLGITIFAFSELNGGSAGRFVVFSEGVVRTGSVQSYIDFPGREIFGILDGTSASGAFEAHINTTKPIVIATGEGEFAHGGPPSNVSTTVKTSTSDGKGNKLNETSATIKSDAITVSSKTSDSEGEDLNETSVSTSNADTTTITSKTSVGNNELNETVITTENPRSGPEAVEQFKIRLSRTSVLVANLGDGSDGGGSDSGGSDSAASDNGGSSGDGSGSEASQNGA